MPINVNTNLRKAHIHGMISMLPAKDRVGRSESALLKLIHASKIYAKNGICALNAVDLTVQDGDYISVTGASGSGKSTLMHILGLLDSLTDGEYLLDGAAVAHLPAKQRARLRSEKIGFVFQQFRLLTGMTALENVALPLALQGVPRHERSERALAVLERVGLSDRANHRPHQLSGGQQQRVAIARAVVTEPCVILADEPTAGLDPMGRDEILDQIASLHETRGITIILVSHSMEDIAKYVERIIVMNHGVKTFDDAPKKVFAHYKELEAIGLAAPQITYIMHALKEKGLDVDTSAINVDEATTSILQALWKKEEDHK